tara:strand:+ start:3711 stop:3986 length:276 start_codon:yes stop_codon:yes gene_type:complete
MDKVYFSKRHRGPSAQQAAEENFVMSKSLPDGATAEILELAGEAPAHEHCVCARAGQTVACDSYGVLRCTREDCAFYMVNFIESVTLPFFI